MAGLGDGLLAGTVVVPEVIQHLGLAQGEAGALQPVQQLLLQAEMGGHQEIMNGFVHRNTSKHWIQTVFIITIGPRNVKEKNSSREGGDFVQKAAPPWRETA